MAETLFEVSEGCKLLCALETQTMNLGTCFLKIFIYKFSSASASVSVCQVIAASFRIGNEEWGKNALI